MRIDAGLDTGDMLLKAETEIGPDETAVELGGGLAVMGADLLVETLAGLAAGTIVPRQAGPCPGHLRAAAEEGGRAHRLEPAGAARFTTACAACSRGPAPTPRFRGQTLHIWAAAPSEAGAGAPAGQLSSRPSPCVVACGAGALELLEVQLEGRKRMSAADFANGQRLAENEILGEPRT